MRGLQEQSGILVAAQLLNPMCAAYARLFENHFPTQQQSRGDPHPCCVDSFFFGGGRSQRAERLDSARFSEGAMGAMLSLSDRNVSKLKQVAPVITGQQSVDAVVLRVTAEQNQLRSAAWDEQPRAFSLRSLRKSPSRG